jgi:replication factor C subunit 1
VQSAAPATKKTPPRASAKPAAPAKRRSAPAKAAAAEDALSPTAKKAIAAVAEAAKGLPTTQELLDRGSVTKMAEGGGGWGVGGGADAEPEIHGGKDHPVGHPDALTKYTFVLSGVLDSMFRQEATDYIKRHGGRVTTGVTGKTSFLLCGAP